MPNSKLKDNAIKKALEGAILNAKKCDSKVWSIEVYKLENALDLINRLQGENERLREEIKKEQLYNLRMTAHSVKTEAYKECNQKTLMCLDKIREEIVDKFIIMCDGNDYNKLNLMSMVDTIDSIYDKHIDNLSKELVDNNG